ncbi:AraC family transcriptional regulator [Massilia sp. Leaf139]|uniref:AraC family transcriptional regulator n=1 Tax=Massilia sp. Leaf139 TaxID=1736272 RepID=UPI000700A1E2|nr:AraC family transcriptional regulator [Massilia sp. Leaf139]KQQ96824.1 AraC family transcriptional regulator [Massilia sp. Leaf139]
MTQPCSIAPPAAANAGRVTGAYLQPLFDAALARGVTPAMLAHAAGLPADALAPLPDSLAASDYLRLLDAGAELAQDPHFGLHVGECVKLGTYSVYGLVLLACRDFGQALDQTMRYEALAHDLGRSHLRVEAADAHYEWISHYPQASRHLADSVFAGIQTFGRWLAGGQLPPAEISLTHAATGDTAEYERIFGKLPRFKAPANSARFAASLLALPLPNADTTLYPVLQQHAERQLGQLSRRVEAPPIVAEVRAAVVRNLAHDRVRLTTIAAELKLSPRTLQRKLAEAGATYQGVLDEARYALARDYLRQPHLSLLEIAFLLGYQEQSAFTHAFKEWSGTNPGAWRERAP